MRLTHSSCDSQIREVPDHQEVYIDKDGFTSIVFDINERIGEKGSTPEIDGRALTAHLEEVVEDDIDRVRVWNTTPTLFSRLEYVYTNYPQIPAPLRIGAFSTKVRAPRGCADGMGRDRPKARTYLLMYK